MYKTGIKYKTGQAELDFSLNPFTFNFEPQMFSTTNQWQYDFLWRRKLFNDNKDIFIQISATATLARNQVLTDKDKSDIFQIKSIIERNFIYIYANSSQQEYKGNLSLTYNFTKEKPSAPIFTITDTQNINFYLIDTNIVNVKTDFSIDNFINWKFKIYTGWERISSKSLLQSLTTSIYPSSLEWDLKTKITDSITINLMRQDTINSQAYTYMRTAEMTFLDNFTVKSGAGITFGYEQNKTFSLSLNYTLGVNLYF